MARDSGGSAMAGEPRRVGRVEVPRVRPARELLGVCRRHGLFLVVLAVGIALRVLVQLAYRPALLFVDSFSYLRVLHTLDPGGNQPIGYDVLLLRPALLAHDLSAVPAVQHVLGLAMGVLTYAVLVRWGAWRWLAALCAVPVLLDAYQLQIEQNVMSDTLFEALLVAALAVLAWRPRPGPVAAAVGGVLLGLAVTVRLVGLPLVVPAALFMAMAAAGWRRRVAGALALSVAFAAPVAAYAGWYHHEYGEYALSAVGGRVRYARVAPFADCRGLSLPPYERSLCPAQPPDQRPYVDDYVWQPTSPAVRYTPPPGMSKDAVLRDFARRVMEHQPLDLAEAVGTDFAKGFYPAKVTMDAHVPVSRWQFQLRYPTYPRYTDTTPQHVAAVYGGPAPSVDEPLAAFLRAYQLSAGYTPGTVLAAALLVGLLGAAAGADGPRQGVGTSRRLGVGHRQRVGTNRAGAGPGQGAGTNRATGRARRSGLRAVCFLYASVGGGVLLAAAALEFSWRYQLPGLVLLPIAGGLGVTALLRGPPAEETAG